MPELDRRRFLAGVGSLAAAPAVGRLRLPDRARQAVAPFPWGVASFDPTTDGVLLWTRVEAPSGGGAVELRWRVANDEALTDVVADGTVTATADRDHCVRVAAEGLASGRTWWFAFTAPDGSRSVVGRTLTLPEAAERLRLGLASCARYADGGFAAYRALADRDVDLVVHVGDYIYEDGFAGLRAHDPAHRCTSLADYRTRYAQHRADPDLQALHARHPMVTVWDDHDVAGNAWRDGAAQHDDARDGPWIDRLRAASRASDEWVPGRTSFGHDGRLKAWRALDLGGLADLVVLDTRIWGRDRQPGSETELDEQPDPPAGGQQAPGRSMLGPDQEAFVVDHLQADDRAPWVLLANQVMLHDLRIPMPSTALGDEVRDRGFLVQDGIAINPDQWDGYPTARARLLQAVGGRGGVVALTGDVHSSWAWEGPANDGGEPTMVELVAPSISSASFADRIPVPAELVELGMRTVTPDLSHVELTHHGYVVVDLTADRVVGEWWHVDPGSPGSQHFQTGRSAPRTPPMRLTEVFEPTSADVPADTALDTPSSSASTEPPDADDGGDGLPLVPIGGGVAAVAALAAGAVALRRRRAPD